MKFIVDNQLPPKLSKFILQKGFISSHVSELNMSSAKDTDLINYSIENNLIIITKDQDFIDRSILSPDFPPIIWIRIGNCRTEHLIESINNVWIEIIRALDKSEKIIEIR